jgi:serine/threonine protein kinase
MGLKEGTLEGLMERMTPRDIADPLFRQMLEALDCLAWKGIVHRDVKPANILFISLEDGRIHFQLGDFGLCNRAISAATYAGSPLYMAPEMFQEGEQTHKVDVWSLFVTILWTLDINGFRKMSKQFKYPKQVLDAVSLAASKDNTVSNIQEMGIINPDERASAAQMLVKCYNGAGLSTPRQQVPIALRKTDDDSTGTAPAPVMTSRDEPKKTRGMQRKANAVANVLYRVEKTRLAPQAQPVRRILPKYS